MGHAVVKDEAAGVPVVELVSLPAELVVEHEVVVRPFKTVTETCRESVDLHLAVMAENIPCKIRVRLSCIVG